MNPQENRQVERKLQDLEAEINQQSAVVPVERQQTQPQAAATPTELIMSWVKHFANWYQRLPDIGKVVVVVAGVMIGFAALNSVFQLVASLISLAFLGLLIFLVYKFVITPKK